jgi:hypothetical protein
MVAQAVVAVGVGVVVVTVARVVMVRRMTACWTWPR